MLYNDNTSCNSMTGGDIFSKIFQTLSVPKNSASFSIFVLLFDIKIYPICRFIVAHMDYKTTYLQKQSKQ